VVQAAGVQFVDPSDLVTWAGALYLFADGGAGNFGLWRIDPSGGASLLHALQRHPDGLFDTSFGGLVALGAGLAFWPTTACTAPNHG
jgi:hypothetical protein